jgi:hypothetical protein
MAVSVGKVPIMGKAGLNTVIRTQYFVDILFDERNCPRGLECCGRGVGEGQQVIRYSQSIDGGCIFL